MPWRARGPVVGRRLTDKTPSPGVERPSSAMPLVVIVGPTLLTLRDLFDDRRVVTVVMDRKTRGLRSYQTAISSSAGTTWTAKKTGPVTTVTTCERVHSLPIMIADTSLNRGLLEDRGGQHIAPRLLATVESDHARQVLLVLPPEYASRIERPRGHCGV